MLVHESAWGATGPWANRKGWEQLAQTTCGAVALVSEGRGQNHLIGALPCDFGTGYLGAIGVMSALRQRQEQGGFWTVEATLAGTIMQVLSLPPAKENAVPVSNEEMPKYLIDQKSDLNGATFTRLAPGARLSKLHLSLRPDPLSWGLTIHTRPLGINRLSRGSGATPTVGLRKRGTDRGSYRIWTRRHHAAAE